MQEDSAQFNAIMAELLNRLRLRESLTTAVRRLPPGKSNAEVVEAIVLEVSPRNLIPPIIVCGGLERVIVIRGLVGGNAACGH